MEWSFLLQLLPVAFVAMAASFMLTKWIRGFALRHNIVDDPRTAERKIHAQPIAFLGGVAVVGAVVLATLAAQGIWQLPMLPWQQLAWLAAAMAVIVVGGVLDDIWNLPAKAQILFPILASCMVCFGAEISIQKPPFVPGTLWSAEVSALVTVVWLMVMTYTTKLLDGLDGLATGIGAIGAGMISLVALTVMYFQPEIAVLAIVVCGALLGFLAWNFNPAQIFLGEVGSEGIGFMLGVLAIASSSKIATALLVMGIPMIDVMHVMWVRIRTGRSPFSGDRNHLHFRLAANMGVRKAVYTLYACSAVFGLMTLSLQTKTKIIALIVAGITAMVLIIKTTTNPQGKGGVG